MGKNEKKSLTMEVRFQFEKEVENNEDLGS
jgi:hypothetical protein